MSFKEGLFDLLETVLSCYRKGVAPDSFEGQIRKRFVDIYIQECAGKGCTLTRPQKDELWKLISVHGSSQAYPPTWPVDDGGASGIFVKIAFVLLVGYLGYRSGVSKGKSSHDDTI